MNEALNLTTNTNNSNFTYATHKYQVTSQLKPNNHTLAKYRSPTGYASNRSRLASAAKAAEVNGNRNKLSNTIDTPTEIR